MSSSYKTDFLKLNQWTDDDKPKRIDFVEDNKKVDLAIKDHFEDSSLHVSSNEKERWNEGGFNLTDHIVSGSYKGDGTASKEISLDKDIAFVIAFITGRAPFSYFSVTKTMYQYLAVATAEKSTTAIKIEGKKFYVTTNFATGVSGETYNLNDEGQEYGYFAFCL